mgnify:CR=1 FL=1
MLGDTALHVVQSGIRDDLAPAPGLTDTSDQTDTSDPTVSADPSVEVHACHGPERQIEVLRDRLLHLFAADPELLQIFSGFRDPEADAARCAQQGNCDGLRRAICSPHRTGTAIDLYVGRLPGSGVDSTAPASRAHMSQGAAYRWLVENAGRFGFTPYVYEPWHWEYVEPWREPSAP